MYLHLCSIVVPQSVKGTLFIGYYLLMLINTLHKMTIMIIPE